MSSGDRRAAREFSSDALKQVFYLTPQPMPETITDTGILKSMSTAALKAMAKKRGITGISKMKKDELVAALSQPLK